MALYIGIKNLIGKGAAWLRSKWTTIVTQLLATFRYRVAGGADNALLPKSNGRAVFDKIYGNTVKWNQLTKDIDFSPYGLTGVTTNGTTVISGTATSGGSVTFRFDNSEVSINDKVRFVCTGTLTGMQLRSNITGTLTNCVGYDGIYNVAATGQTCLATVTSGNTVTGSIFFKVHNLTKMFGTDAEIAAALGISVVDITTATGVAAFDNWLALNVGAQDYYPHDEGSLVSFKGQGVKTVGFNQWDEETLKGYYSTNNGEFTSANNWRCNKNPIDVIPGNTYYITLIGVTYGYALFYDTNDSYVGYVPFGSTNLITVPDNVTKMNFYCGTGLDTGHICINISDPAKNGTYEPYKEEVVDLSGAYINVWDEEWEQGAYNITTGEKRVSNTLRNKNFIPVVSGKTYYFKAPATLTVLYYYANYGYAERRASIVNNTLTIPDGVAFINFFGNAPYWQSHLTYAHDICINVSNADIDGTYYPHALQSAGSVTDEVTESGLTKKLMAVDLGNLVWQYRGAQAANVISTTSITNYAHKGGKLSVCYPYSAYNSVTNINQMPNAPDKCHTFFATSSGNSLYIKDSDIAESDINAQGHCQKLEGVILIYELATPVVVPHDTPMQYAVDKYSTEELLVPASVAGEPTSTAIVADIEYQAK